MEWYMIMIVTEVKSIQMLAVNNYNTTTNNNCNKDEMYSGASS